MRYDIKNIIGYLRGTLYQIPCFVVTKRDILLFPLRRICNPTQLNIRICNPQNNTQKTIAGVIDIVLEKNLIEGF